MKLALASLLLRCLAATWRIDRSDLGVVPPHVVLSFWHADMLCFWKAFAKTNAVGLTSLSKDGDILATLLNDWDFEVLRGSSSKGGKEVLRSMTDAASRARVLLTPDGPRGPAKVFKPGALIAAQRADVELIHCSAQISRAYVFEKSWDQFRLPLPFARIKLQIIERLKPSADLSPEQISALLVSLSDRVSNPADSSAQS